MNERRKRLKQKGKRYAKERKGREEKEMKLYEGRKEWKEQERNEKVNQREYE